MKYLISLILSLFAITVDAQEKTKVIIRQEGFGNKHELKVVFGNQLAESNAKGEVLYEKEMEINAPMYGMILNKKNRFSGFWLEPGKGEVIVRKKGFPQATEVKGSKSHEIYLSLRFADDNKAFIQAFMENNDNPIALDVLNTTFKFQKFEQEELQRMFDTVTSNNKKLLPYVSASLNTFGLDDVTLNGQIVDFTGDDQNGITYDTEDYRGKYLLLDFASTGCGPCWMSYPDMITETDKYENLQVITYNEDAEIDAWNNIAKRRNIELPWPVLWKDDNKLEIFERYNVEGWPLHFLISPKGKVIERWYGSGGNRLAKKLEKHIK